MFQVDGKIISKYSDIAGVLFDVSQSGLLVYQTSANTLSICSLIKAHSAVSACRSIALGVDESLTALSISPDGQWVAVSSERGVKIWSSVGALVTRQPLRSKLGQEFTVQRLTFSPDSKALLGLADNGLLYVWPIDNALQVKRLQAAIAPLR
ncbi:MAG: hypothetical protein K2Q15_05210 [Burkholderiales bacterium]|nr:hypothetical protein [Burkholderiales bacterium]